MSIKKIENLNVVKELKKNEELYKKFENLVNHYADILDSGAIVREVGFTPHDFSHHCRGIYNVLDEILPSKFYEVYSRGNNLFILLVAVLLHDISMAQDCSEKGRRNHSCQSQKYIRDEALSKSDTVLKSNCRREFVEALGDVIYAHSDIKAENGEVSTKTFEDVVKRYKDNSDSFEGEVINVPFLAAILRLADELDISYSRIEGTGYENKVNNADSQPYYEICEYFKPVQWHKEKPYELSIEVYDLVFEKLQEEQRPAIAGLIIERYLKIKKEFENLYSIVLSNTKYAGGGIWNIEKIVLKDEGKYSDYVKKKESSWV